MNIIEATRKAMEGHIIRLRKMELFYSYYFKTLCYLDPCRSCGNGLACVHNWFPHCGDALISDQYEVIGHFDQWPMCVRSCCGDDKCKQNDETWNEYSLRCGVGIKGA